MPDTAVIVGAQTDWPLTVVARWKDPGFSERELRWFGVLFICVLWMFTATLVFERRLSPALFGLAILVAAPLAWQWIRRRPADLEMVLEPDRLRLRGVVSATPSIELLRRHAGALMAAESGVDWRERFVLLTDDADREVARFRARNATVEFRDVSSVSESWWRSTMPPGTAARVPPTELSTTALLGAWWPRPDRRRSVRGSFHVLRPWKESDLSTYEAWDRRERRQAGLLIIGALLFTYALAIIGVRWSMTDALVYVPPGVIGLALLLRGVLR
jgi:hypothetical protein